ncbi:MAG: C40 family peptidase [Thermodesulfobacteriota bacterium]
MRIQNAAIRNRRVFRLPVLIGMLIGLAACAAPSVPPTTTLPPPVPPKRIRPRLPTISYTIQVGAFSTIERAALYADRLQAAGLDAYYFVDEDRLCKVRFEKFPTKKEAEARALVLQARGLIDEFYIIQPSVGLATTAMSSTLRSNLVSTAHRFIGTPYSWGGTSVRSGFDCSGLTMTVYRLNGLELPRMALSQYRNGVPVDRDELRQGDLVFFDTDSSGGISHVGIYTGRDRFIHAPGRGKQIRIASLSNAYFQKRYRGARRYFD